MLMGGCQESNLAFDQIVNDYPEIDYHLKGGMVIDGSGSPAKQADVLIVGDEIVYVGIVDNERITVKEVIDLNGMIVAPGFIDPHSHGDPLRKPEFHNFFGYGSNNDFSWSGWF